MTEIKKFWKPGLTLTGSLIAERFWPLLALLLVTSAINIFSESYLAGLDKNADTARLVTQISVGLWGLIEGIVLILILAFGISRVRSLNSPALEPKPFAGEYLGSFLAEYFRGLAQVLLWSLLVLVPGFVRYVRLLFLPYVVLFSKAYRDGDADAIALSVQLTRGRFKELMILTVVPAAIEIGLVFLPQLVDDLHLWPVRLAIDAIGYALSVWLFAFLYLIFEHALLLQSQSTPAPLASEGI